MLAAPDLAAPCDVVLGRSVLGTRICAVRSGEPGAQRRALVVGSIHGDEPGGLAVTRRLRARRDVTGVELWTIDTLNPDGLERHTRWNARGVDLNRNFPVRWRHNGVRGSRYYAGPRPSSEPETRMLRRFATELRPEVSVWFHQPYGFVVLPDYGGSPRLHRRYARVAGIPARPLDPLPGTAITWQNARLGGTAMVVELRAGAVSARTAESHVRAVLSVTGARRAPVRSSG